MAQLEGFVFKRPQRNVGFSQEVARTAVTLLDRCRKIPVERQEAIYREICDDLPAVEDGK